MVSTPKTPADPRSDAASRKATDASVRAVSDAAWVVPVEDLLHAGQNRTEVAAELGEAWLASALAETDAEVRGPGRFVVQVDLQADGTAYVRGRLELSLAVPCARCLEPALVDGTTDLVGVFEVRGGSLASGSRTARASKKGSAGDDDEDGETLPSDDLDLYTYDGRALDLGPMLREQVALAYPMRALCALGEACKGLCPECGVDANREGGRHEKGCSQGAEGDSLPAGEAAVSPGSRLETPWQRALGRIADPATSATSATGRRGRSRS